MSAENTGVRSFRISDYLEVRLVNGKTAVYVGGRLFRYCRFLVLVNPHRNSAQKDIKSIDDLEELAMDQFEEPLFDLSIFGITPEQEFWGHCSNLQAWYEHGYDTRLLHSSLSFPLLKALGEAGDEYAMRMFKLEIAKRFIESPDSIREYLRAAGHLKIFTESELDDIYRDVLGDEYDVILDLGGLIGRRLEDFYDGLDGYFSMTNNTVTYLSLYKCELSEFPEAILRLKHLRKLRIISCGLRELPEEIGELKELEFLELRNNCLESLPESISELNNLYWLDLSKNQLKHIHELKKGLPRLSTLNLYDNPIELDELMELLRVRERPRDILTSYGEIKRTNDRDLLID
ncbi:MAG: leucine-rich repeat domain-containing protein [Promethearchaeota archaeon]